MDICLTNVKGKEFHKWDECHISSRYNIYYKQPTEYKHFFWSEKKDGKVVLVFGNIYYDSINSFMDTCHKLFAAHNYDEIMDLDGEFVAMYIDDDTGKVIVVSEKEGIIPLFYKANANSITITTNEELLFYDFCIDDLNYHAINDFLRFGCLIGSETMSMLVHRIAGGTVFSFDQKTISIKRLYKFYYKDTSDDAEELMKNVSNAYRKAIEKRMLGKEEDTCIFLSGGLDSRFLLAEMNATLSSKVSTYSFGQPFSEEVNIARTCADVECNSFRWIKTLPLDFVSNAENYEKVVCGADMFPQSYIIGAVSKIPENHFVTGYILDALLGGTFLTQDAVDFEGELSEYVQTHLKELKMNVFSKEELVDMSLNAEKAKYFDYDNTGLINEAKNYDSIPVRDCIQAFAVDNRDKNLVLLREIVPAKYKDCSYVSCDKDFVKAASHISASLRLDHRFYHDLFNKEARDYSKIIYNNTQLPAFAPVDKWKLGSNHESVREELFEEIIEKYNSTHEDKIYYPHYYSDFNGYSRYDPDWLNLFGKYLFSSETIITKILFSEEKLKVFFNEHISGRKNRRKELIYITSLEIFLRTVKEYNAGGEK